MSHQQASAQMYRQDVGLVMTRLTEERRSVVQNGHGPSRDDTYVLVQKREQLLMSDTVLHEKWRRIEEAYGETMRGEYEAMERQLAKAHEVIAIHERSAIERGEQYESGMQLARDQIQSDCDFIHDLTTRIGLQVGEIDKQ